MAKIISYRECCNPFKITHKYAKLVDVTENVGKNVIERGMNIELGEKICQQCRNRLSRKTKSAVDQSSASTSSGQPEQDTPMEVGEIDELSALIGPATSSESKESGDPDENFNPAIINISDLKKATDELLKILGVDAIDDKKIRGKKYQIEVMSRLLTAEPSHDAERIIHQLEKKFAEATSHNMKIKILSVLPKDWSAVKIRQEFGDFE